MAVVPLLGLLLLILAAWAFFSLAWTITGLFLMIAISGLIGAVADAIVPGQLPYGWVGAVAVGFLGSIIGSLVIGPIGPVLWNIPVVSALIGAIVVVLLAEVVMKGSARLRR